MSTIKLLNNTAYFMLPGFYEHYTLYKKMNDFLSICPEAKRDNIEIYCYYGNIPFCSWDGGRTFLSYQPCTIEQIKEIQDYYNNNLKTKIRLVFTNNLLKKEHLWDRYNNLSLQIFNNHDNEIVLNSSILEEYLQQQYPSYNLIASTTKCSTKEEINNDLNNTNYLFTCIDYNLNHDWNFLNSITEKNKVKTEFLVNPICRPGCSQRKEHYRLNSLFSLTYGMPYKMKHCEMNNYSTCNIFNKAIITIDEINNIYIPAGFNYFKLEGRTWSNNEMAITLANYLIKPEYQNLFLWSILDN